MPGPVLAPLQEICFGSVHVFGPGLLQPQLTVTPGQSYLSLLGSTYFLDRTVVKIR